MAETDVMSVLQNVHSCKNKIFFIIGIKDAWVKSDNLKTFSANIFHKQKFWSSMESIKRNSR